MGAEPPEPPPPPSFTWRAVAFSPDSTYLAAGRDAQHVNGKRVPTLQIYKRNGDSFEKLQDPATAPIDSAYDVAFSHSGTYLAVATAGDVLIYKRSGDVFTKLTDLVDGGRGVSFSPDDVYLAAVSDTQLKVIIYKRSGDAFTWLTDLPASVNPCRKVQFSPDGELVAYVGGGSPYVRAYQRSGDEFTHVSFGDEEVDALDLGFSPDSTYLAVARGRPTFDPNMGLSIYKRSDGAYTKLSVSLPSTYPCYGVAFAPDGTHLLVAVKGTSNSACRMVNRSGDTFTGGSYFVSGTTGEDVAISPNGTYAAVALTSGTWPAILKRSGSTYTVLSNPFAE